MGRLGLVMVLCCASSAARAGVSLVWEFDGPDNLPKAISLACDGTRVRMEPAGVGKTPLILWDGDAKVVTMADAEAHTYRRITEAQLKGIMDQTKSLFSGPEGQKRRALMEKQLARISPEQRAQVEALLAQQTGAAGAPVKEQPKWSFTPTGKAGKAAGYDCERYSGKRGDQTMDLCAVPWARSPVQREDSKCFDSMNELSKSMGSQPIEAAQRDFSLFPGFPVMTVMESGGHKVLTTLRSLKKEKLPASFFELPAGYTEQALPGMP